MTNATEVFLRHTRGHLRRTLSVVAGILAAVVVALGLYLAQMPTTTLRKVMVAYAPAGIERIVSSWISEVSQDGEEAAARKVKVVVDD